MTSPAWALALREDQRPPVLPQGGPVSPLATPSDPQLPRLLPRGKAKTLTQRLEPAEQFQQNDASPVRTPAHETGGNQGSGQVVVNINNTAAKPNPATSAEAASERAMLEKLYAGEFSRDANRQLSQFGYDYFARPPSSADELGPVPDDYVLGAGDELAVDVWGAVTINARLIVDRDGQIALPDVGAVAVAGRSLPQTAEAIRVAIGVTKRDFELSVAIGRLRRIAVHVVGEVAKPGLVEVPARATVLTALLAAGGPTKGGTLRRIKLDQDGRTLEIDLYSFLTAGERQALTLIRPGAVITVSPIGPTAAVAGLVQRPGIYELNGPATVATLLQYAGGLTAFTFTPQAQIERTVAGRGRQKFDVAITGDSIAEPMGDGELLLIGAVDTAMQPSVAVEGEVVRPGTYEYKPGLRVADLITRADGLTIDAYLPQALISRQVGPSGEVLRVPGRVSFGSSRRVIVVDLARALANDPEQNLELMPLDQLEVRSVRQSLERPEVSVLGAVRQPGKYELTAGLTVSALVAMAGNLTNDVYYDEAELIRKVRDETSPSLDVRRYRFNLGQAMSAGCEDPVLQNGDQLVIRSLRAEQVTVRIEGEVSFPGSYVFPAGSRISDMIAAAGGVNQRADFRAAGFYRKSAQQAEKEKLRNLTEQTRRAYEGALEHLVKDGASKEGLAGKLALLQTQDLMERIANTEVHGRVVIPFIRPDFPTSPHNLTLEDGDRLVIPRHRETIGVVGLVFNPTNFVAEPGTTVSSVIDRAGGLAEFADDQRIYVIRADGTVESLAQTSGQRLAMDTLVLPGDVVLVPRAPLERSFGAQLADVLSLARQAAEVGLLASRLGNVSGKTDITTILPGQTAPQSVQDYSDTILNRRR